MTYNFLAHCCPCITYGRLRSKFLGTDDCATHATIFYFTSACCLSPLLGAVNRYEMRERYNIIGLDQTEGRICLEQLTDNTMLRGFIGVRHYLYLRWYSRTCLHGIYAAAAHSAKRKRNWIMWWRIIPREVKQILLSHQTSVLIYLS